MMVSVCFASNVYEVGNDVELDSTIYWPSDYKISMLAFDDTDSTMLEWIYDMLTDIWNDMRAGFEFVDEDIVAGNTLLSQINVTSSSMYTLLDGMDSTLDYVLQGVGQTNGYLAITNNKLADLIGTVGVGNSSLSSLVSLTTSGNSILSSLHDDLSLSGHYVINGSGGLDGSGGFFDITTILNNGFKAVRSYSIVNDVAILGVSGVLDYTGGIYPFTTILNNGFRGVRALIAGSESDNVYSGTSIDNSNESSSFSATGLGPMLNTWLGDIQNDLGVLSYVFASPQDLELKEESADNMSAIGDSLLSPDSSSSVKVSDIAGISEASTAIKGFGDTGVSIGQAFAQLGDASLFRFFSSEAASDLDTSVSSYSRNASDRIVTNYYADSRDEFYSIINGGEE